MRKKINKKKREGDNMNCKKGSKWLLLVAVLVLVVIAVGVVYVFASSSDDIIAPVTTATITGTKEAAPNADYYKDQATVTLSATDGEENNGVTASSINKVAAMVISSAAAASASSIDKVAGESDLSLTYQPAQPSSGSFTDNFDQGINRDMWSTTDDNYVYSGSNGDIIISGQSPYRSNNSLGINSNNVFNLPSTPASYFVEVEMTITEINGTGYYTLFSIDNNDAGGVRQDVSISTDQWGIGTSGFGNVSSLPIGVGQKIKLRIETYNSTQIEFKADTNMDGTFESTSGIQPFNMWTGETRINFVVGGSILVSWDNLVTNFSNPPTPASYLMARTGMELTGMEMNGVSYMSPLPEIGLPSGVAYWGGQGPTPVPQTFSSLSGDVYVYLMSVDFTAMGLGPKKLTMYATMNPATFGQNTIVALNSGAMGAPLPATVDAFGKAFTNSGNSTFTPAILPITSEGSIAADGTVVPPDSTDPVVSGVDKTYYRIGDSGSFSEYAAPVIVNTAGVNNFYYYSTDKAGNTEPVKSVVVKVDRDSDGDGIYNNYDGCPTVKATYFQGCPSAIQVTAQDWTLDGSNDKNHPKSKNNPLASLPVKIYDYNTIKADYKTCKDNYKEEDANGEEGDSEDCIKPEDYDVIVDKYTPLYTGTTDASGIVKIGVNAVTAKPATRYIVIGDWVDASSLNKLHNKLVKKVHAEVGKTKNVNMRLECVINSTDKKCYATKKTTVTGSGNLDIIEPEYIEYTEGQEYYPIIFQSSDDFTAATSITPPDGWTPDSTQIVREILPGATDTAQFNLTPSSAVASSGKVAIAAVNDAKVKSGSLNIDYQATGGSKKNYKSSYQVGKKAALKVKAKETPKGLFEQLKEKADANKKITQQEKNKNLGQKIKNIVKRIF